jgi:predicted aldo/keto reductase-like oxidoreductase
MPAVNPVSLDDFKPELAALKAQDVGIVAMKTTGVKDKPIEGPRRERVEKLGDISKYNEWECKKLYMLNCTDGLIDAVIAAINDVKEMDRTLGLVAVKLSAETARELRALVRLQMAGACHLCGNCQTVCPEHIAVTDMIRYHAYVHQYNEKDLARDLYARAGYDPGKLCTNCGRCADVCPSDVPITRILGELAASVA